ncbi:hypothetical protein ACFRAM_04720 [Paenibacillus sp. NPDC056722]|uniref:hypothetical protein n=1 Tax=Paenibacillus sp. NPDC056722 TaxID=3345924 RepID=UPI00369048AE
MPASIPVHLQKIILLGDNPGNLLALGMDPNLILQSDYGDAEDAMTNEAMSKIAPSAMFNRSAPTYERLRILPARSGWQRTEYWCMR